MRVHGEFQPHLSPGGGRADRQRFCSWTGSRGKKVEDLLKNSSFENDIQSPIFTLKATYSHRHEGSLNEDTGSFDLY